MYAPSLKNRKDYESLPSIFSYPRKILLFFHKNTITLSRTLFV